MSSSPIQLWRRLPLVVRAVITGVLVLFGNQPAIALLFVNWSVAPSIPWSVPLAVVYLWFYWQYLNGRWWPRATAESRRVGLRAHALPPLVWRWSLLAGGLAIARTAPLAFLVPLGVELPPALLRGPVLTSLSILLLLSAIAGIVEEAAFRGYMQGPIERRFGPVLAILVVSAVFGLLHLPGQSITVMRMVLILVASVVYGALAHITGSILPGIVLHATGSAFGLCLLWWLSKQLGTYRSQPNVGDALFWLYMFEMALLAIAALWAFRRLVLAAKSGKHWT